MTREWMKLVAENLVMMLPENRQPKQIYSFRGEEIERFVSSKIKAQERLLVTVNGYSGPEVAR